MPVKQCCNQTQLPQRVAFVQVKTVNKIVESQTRQPRETACKMTILQIDLCVNGIPSDEIYKDEQYMQSITKQIEKLVDMEQRLQEEPLESNIFSEEAAMKIYEAGNCELHEIPQRTVKVQFQRCQA